MDKAHCLSVTDRILRTAATMWILQVTVSREDAVLTKETRSRWFSPPSQDRNSPNSAWDPGHRRSGHLKVCSE